MGFELSKLVLLLHVYFSQTLELVLEKGNMTWLVERHLVKGWLDTLFDEFLDLVA